MFENKKGWTRIIEAFIAIALITSALLLILNQSYKSPNISSGIYDAENAILKNVRQNDTLRQDILNAVIPVRWEDFESKGLGRVRTEIISGIPSYLNCEAEICETTEICELNKAIEKNIYVKSTIISASFDKYDPRQLKLFCWMK